MEEEISIEPSGIPVKEEKSQDSVKRLSDKSFLELMCAIPSLDKISIDSEDKESHQLEEEQIDELVYNEEGEEEEFEDFPWDDDNTENDHIDESDLGSGLLSDDSDKDDAPKRITIIKPVTFIVTDLQTSKATSKPTSDIALQRYKERDNFFESEHSEDVLMKKTAHECIEELINKTVTANYTEEYIRKRLNKKKVISELKKILKNYDEEQKTSRFLHQKIQLFRRKKKLQPPALDNPETIKDDARRYHKDLLQLEELLAREENFRKLSEENLDALEKQLNEIQIKNASAEKELNLLIQNTFLPNLRIQPEKNEKKPVEEEEQQNKKNQKKEKPENKYLTLYNQFIAHMAKVREDISIVRFQLFQHQHKYRTIKEKLYSVENLGDGYRLSDYQNLYVQTTQIRESVKEKKEEFNKAHTTFCLCVEKKEHLINKKVRLVVELSDQEKGLSLLLERRGELRMKTNEKKMEHIRIRRKINTLKSECELLDKPDLLLDYDSTLRYFNELNTRIGNLQSEQESVNKKLKALDQQNIR